MKDIPAGHASGAKAHADFTGLMSGMNPRPTARQALSPSCGVMPLLVFVPKRKPRERETMPFHEPSMQPVLEDSEALHYKAGFRDKLAGKHGDALLLL
jgi:hypothetical protein